MSVKTVALLRLNFLVLFLTASLIACGKKNSVVGVPIIDTLVNEDKLWISEVKFQDPSTEIYLGSPSILRLANGDILSCLDYFGVNRPRDSKGRSNRTSVYRSKDDGLTWNHIAEIDGMYWGNLFDHKGAVYLLGTTAATASIGIMKSVDGGVNWTKITGPKTGLLFEDGNGNAPRYHCAPMPVVRFNGRLFRAFENIADNTLPGMRGYNAFVISIDENDDLLDASNWQKSSEVSFDGKWDKPGSFATTGWLEGNMVVGPDGKLWNILRVNSSPFYDRAAMVEVSANGKVSSFTPENFINFPGGQSKFVIRKDEQTGIYWMMTNNNTNLAEAAQRNVLSLYASKDLRTWHHAKTLMEDDQDLTDDESIALTGFQYPDWQFDGENMIYLSRTAYGKGVPRYHDSNRITFGKVYNYKEFTPAQLK